jgi:hypothetical protein
MNPDETRVPIFTTSTSFGEWCVSTDPATFEITGHTYGFPYYLTVSTHADYQRTSNEGPYDLVRAVAEHRTGLAKWDDSPEKVSDCVDDWTLHLDKRFQMKLLGEYLRRHSTESSMREMVDYFEHKHGYLMDRRVVQDLMRELIMTGQLEALPDMFMAPVELDSLRRMANVWLSNPDE